jgi:CSLREA domain-containing protein
VLRDLEFATGDSKYKHRRKQVKKDNYFKAARIVFAGMAFGLLFCLSAFPANAATITVNTLVDEAGVGTDCSLREAMTAANNNSVFGGCSAGSGTDNIVFSVTGTIQLNSQLPAVASSMNIVNASGPSGLTIRRNTDQAFGILLILAAPSVVKLSGLTISNGRATAGGAIVNGANLTVSNCVITGNTAFQFAGGGIYSIGTLAVSNTTISGNIATPSFGNGGAGIENAGQLSVTNSTISGNRIPAAGSNCAGGISSSASLPVIITNSTITDNEASGSTCGGGIRRNSGKFTVANSIIAGNRNNNVTPDVNGAFASSGSNLIGSAVGTGFTNGVNGDHVGTLAATVDPQLGPLQDNGGPTFTHALLSKSPAIDAGNNSLAVDPSDNSVLTVDQRGTGFPRIVHDKVDVGSFETAEIPNSAPMVTASPVSIQQGTSKLNVPVAVIGDREDSPGTLLLTIDGGLSASSNGINVSNITVDPSGNVAADIASSCAASNAAFVLRVTDSGGLSRKPPWQLP